MGNGISVRKMAEGIRHRSTKQMQEGEGRIKRVVWTIGPDEDRNSGGRLIDLDADEPDPRDLMIPDYITGWGIEPLEHPVYETQPMERRRFRKPLKIIVSVQPREMTLRPRGERPAKARERSSEAAPLKGVAAVYTHCMATVASR